MSSVSLEDALKRGQGWAFREVSRRGPELGSTVVQCVLQDPRWDRQLEQREAYYAQLLMAARVSLQPLEAHVIASQADEADTWLCVDVLTQLCWRGEATAPAVVNRAIAESGAWRQFLESLDALGGPDLLREVVSLQALHALLERVGTHEFEDTIRTVDAPWDEWASAVPALRFLLAGADDAPSSARSVPLGRVLHRLGRGEARPVNAAQSSQALLEHAARYPAVTSEVIALLAKRTGLEHRRTLYENARTAPARARTIALRVLARQGNADFLDEAVEFLRSHEDRSLENRGKDAWLRGGFIKYLCELPLDCTEPLSRKWLMAPWPLSVVGERILAEHATPADRELLEQECEKALTDDDMYRLCTLVEGLGRVGDARSLGLFYRIHDEAPYAKARQRALLAMSHQPRDAQVGAFLNDALWDCEDGTRYEALKHVGLTLDARRRLREVASDPFEDDELRERAEERLA